MAILKCKMCGGDLEITEGMTVCECEYCGAKQTVPSADDEKKMTLFNRANRLRFNCEFDKASGVYESIVADFPEEAEAYWGLVLCKYGIEYVDDPATAKKIPTCHRSSFESVMDDANFEQVMENSDTVARSVYREEAKQIEELRKGIIEVSSKEEPYDIFICYKETDENGDRTVDSVIAQDVYDALTEKGYKVFFSRITLEDKLGQEYEPYIFAALNSAKVMLAFGTNYEYYNAVWVKNEWSRFLQLIAKGEKKTLIPCYKNIDAYDMPKEFAKLQAQDMGKVGAIQDLLRGIEKILPANGGKSEGTVNDTVVTSPQSATTDSLLKRAFMFLEDKDWQQADEYCNKVLDIDPENAQAYLGLLLSDLKLSTSHDLSSQTNLFDQNKYYLKFIRFASDDIKMEINDYLNRVKDYLDEQKRIQKEIEETERLRKQQEKEHIEQERKEENIRRQKQFENHLKNLQYKQERALSCKKLASKVQHGLVAVKSDGTLYSTQFGTNALDIEKVFGDIAITYSGKAFNIGGYYSSIAEKINERLAGKKILQLCTFGTSNYICLSEDGVVYSNNPKIDGIKNIVSFSARSINRGLLLTTEGKAIGFGLTNEEMLDISYWDNIAMVDCVNEDLIGCLTIFGEIKLTKINTANKPLPSAYAERHKYFYKAIKWKNIIDFVITCDEIYGLDENGIIKIANEYGPEDYDIKHHCYCHYNSNVKKAIALLFGSPVCAIYEDGTIYYGKENITTYQNWKLFNNFDTLHEERKQAQEQLAIRKQRMADNQCQYCGGQFKGKLFKKCASCGKSKDY